MSQTEIISKQELEIRKLADTHYPIEEVLRRRCSTLAFSDRPVEPDKLRSLFEAARWAASSRNEQPWSFILANKHENPEDYERLLSCVNPHNRAWARHAPVLVLSVAKLHSDAGGMTNYYAFHDVGMAVANLTIQATTLDLLTHLMGGFDSAKARELFSIPDSHAPVTAIALGYFGGLEDLPAEIRERELAPRKRRPFKNFVFSGRWGHPSPLIPD